jgi:hypothetical protein
MTARSVPATPLAGNPPNASSVTRADISALAGVKSPGTPLGHPAAGGGADHSATHTLADSRAFSTGDLTATLSRLAGVGSQFDGQYPQGGATEVNTIYLHYVSNLSRSHFSHHLSTMPFTQAPLSVVPRLTRTALAVGAVSAPTAAAASSMASAHAFPLA